MSTLIVPCLGRRIVDGVPEYLHRHPKGKMLIKWSIEGIFSEQFNRVIIVLLEEDVKRYHADDIIKSELCDYPIEISVIETITSGPAETVYYAILKKDVTGPVIIKDVDNHLKIEKVPQGNFVAGLDLNTWEQDIHNLRNKSFLILNEQGNLLDIIEKKIQSEVICLGLYGFNKAEDFIDAYKKLNDTSYPISRLYISHVISYLIGYSGRVFHYIEASEYENWGTERLWKDMQRDYTLFFVDLDNILNKNGVLSEQNKKKLLLLQCRGASFIGYTVEDEEYKISALKILKDAGLEFIKIIYGCPYSEIKDIIVSEKALECKVIEL